MGALRIILITLALVISGAGASFAQSLGQIVSPVVTLNRDLLFNESLFGQRVKQDLSAETAQMIAKTTEIENALADEEQALTEKRETLDPETFRNLALAFDAKVQNLRAERQQAQTDLQATITKAQEDFFRQVGPILGQLMRERGAVLIIDQRAILLAASDVDITEAAIERVDAVLGDGADPEASQDSAPTGASGEGMIDTIPAPETLPDTESSDLTQPSATPGTGQ
ncbi:MAG: OmpH family outer membrane protein [Maritimibacter sp.]|jgi:Skp family chaperone for outer membrane proteins